jgi:hypothetical protein
MLVYVTAIWYNLWSYMAVWCSLRSFGIFFPRFGLFGPRKIWQPWSGQSLKMFLKKIANKNRPRSANWYP